VSEGWGSYVRDYIRNWRESDAPLGAKLRLTARNRLRALGRGCCGHPGEPGC
jgi:hypothetical protein